MTLWRLRQSVYVSQGSVPVVSLECLLQVVGMKLYGSGIWKTAFLGQYRSYFLIAVRVLHTKHVKYKDNAK